MGVEGRRGGGVSDEVVCVCRCGKMKRDRDGNGEVACVGVGAAVHGCVAVVTAVRVRGSQCGATPIV